MFDVEVTTEYQQIAVASETFNQLCLAATAYGKSTEQMLHHVLKDWLKGDRWEREQKDRGRFDLQPVPVNLDSLLVSKRLADVAALASPHVRAKLLAMPGLVPVVMPAS